MYNVQFLSYYSLVITALVNKISVFRAICAHQPSQHHCEMVVYGSLGQNSLLEDRDAWVCAAV